MAIFKEIHNFSKNCDFCLLTANILVEQVIQGTWNFRMKFQNNSSHICCKTGAYLRLCLLKWPPQPDSIWSI